MLGTAKIVFISVTLLCAMSGFCYGAPVVTSHSGGFTQGGSVTVSGTGFGQGDITPLVWDDFEGGASGAVLNSTPKIGTWLLNQAPNPIYSTIHARSGIKSSYGATTNPELFTQFYAPASRVMPDSYYYISYWFKYGYPSGGTGQSKLVQLWGTYQVGDYNPGFMAGGASGNWWAAAISLEKFGPGYLQQDISTPAQNTWHHCELILKQSDANTTNGQVTMKLNGVTQYNRVNVKTRELSGQSWQTMRFFYGFTNMPSGTKYVALDDVYMNNSWARVEIGNNATYANCTQRELQIPTAWSDTSFTISVNRGSLGSSQTNYLFVVDANGNVNAQGYPVQLGSGAGAPPSPPTGLTIKYVDASH
jgi:hypothetical protein